MNTPHPVVVVIGPSGSGKSSVVRALHARGLVTVRPTWTTRPRRADEGHDSVEHRFVSEANFAWLESHGYFLDTTSMFGLPHRYGLPGPARFGACQPELVMLRAPLIERFRRFGAEFTTVQIEDSPERIAARLAQRHTPAAELRARLVDNARECALGRELADVVLVNDSSVDALAQRFIAALLTEVAACKTKRPGPTT